MEVIWVFRGLALRFKCWIAERRRHSALALRIENQKLRALLDFQDEPVEGPLDGVYSQYRDRIEQLTAAVAELEIAADRMCRSISCAHMPQQAEDAGLLINAAWVDLGNALKRYRARPNG